MASGGDTGSAFPFAVGPGDLLSASGPPSVPCPSITGVPSSPPTSPEAMGPAATSSGSVDPPVGEATAFATFLATPVPALPTSAAVDAAAAIKSAVRMLAGFAAGDAGLCRAASVPSFAAKPLSTLGLPLAERDGPWPFDVVSGGCGEADDAAVWEVAEGDWSGGSTMGSGVGWENAFPGGEAPGKGERRDGVAGAEPTVRSPCPGSAVDAKDRVRAGVLLPLCPSTADPS
jgi:hypothetical protein